MLDGHSFKNTTLQHVFLSMFKPTRRNAQPDCLLFPPHFGANFVRITYNNCKSDKNNSITSTVYIKTTLFEKLKKSK
ncbi:hypothetical protein Hanom_Chr05g00418581 [Helianthus anomalus]